MLLFKTTCNIDWKGRPTHTLEFLGEAPQGQLVLKMDTDILTWQAQDIAGREWDDLCEDIEVLDETNDNAAMRRHITKRVKELLTEPELTKKWKALGDRQTEMDSEPSTPGRSFINYVVEGDICTTVYHLVESLTDLSPN